MSLILSLDHLLFLPLYIYQKKELAAFNSKKYLELNIFGLANIFVTVSKFWLPVRLDYRGRVVCVSEFLNYQGNE